LVTLTVFGSPVLSRPVLPKSRLVGVMVSSGTVPTPLSETLCVPTLSTMDRVPVRVPAAEGRNATEIVHEAPAARDPPQVCVWKKSPLAEMLLMLSEAFPVFDSLTDWEALVVPFRWLPKVREDGDTFAVATGAATPLPDRLTPSGDEGALLETLNEPVRVPVAEGLNET
jgi:hypothetical protein